VVTVPAGATVLNLDVDWARWGSDRDPGGIFTAIFGTTLLGLLVPLAYPVMIDTLIAETPNHDAEAIWRASVVTPTQVLWQTRAPLYVYSADLPLFKGGPARHRCHRPDGAWRC